MATRKRKQAVQTLPKLINLVERRQTPYQASDDIAGWIHSNKTHRTVSEAFRDADYATPIWRCETEWDRTKHYLGWIAMWLGFLGFMYLLGTWVARVMP